VKKIFHDPGLRFVFSTRSPVPDLLKEDGTPFYKDKPFTTGKDDVIREAPGRRRVRVAFGETVYRALDAVIRLQEAGVKVGW
jgi:transketolase C-terminal domain/subunit